MEATATATDVRVRYEPLPHQWEVLTSDKKLTFLGGGVGCGKTDVGTIWLLQQLSEAPPGVIYLVCANTYTQLFDSTLTSMYENLSRLHVPHRPDELPRSHGPFDADLFVNGHWRRIRCRSLEHYHRLAGQQIGGAWIDEVYQTVREAINIIVARSRDPHVEKNKILLTTTLDDPSTWMYDMFVDNFNPKIHKVIYAKTEDNPHLRDDYLDDMKAQYSERMFERMCLSRWVSLEAGRIYYAFDRTDHVDESIKPDPNLPLAWTNDFNIGTTSSGESKPMSSCIAQVRRETLEIEGNEIVQTACHAYDEIVIETADTNDAIAEFQNRTIECEDGETRQIAKWPAGIIVYGDAAGKSRDTRSRQTDYGLMREAGLKQFKVPARNPPLRDSHNLVNAVLRSADGRTRFKIHPRCQTLIKGLETVRLKSGAQYLEEETREQHVTTALRYFVAVEFPLRQRASAVSWLSH